MVTTNQLDSFSAAEKKKVDFVVDKKGKDGRHIGFRTMDRNGTVKIGENSAVQSFTGTGKSSIGEFPKTTQNENDDKSRKRHKSKDVAKKSHNKKDKDMVKEKKKKLDKTTQEERINGPDADSINATVEGTKKPRKQMDINGLLNSSSSGRSFPVGYEVMASAPLSDQRNNAAVEGTEKPRKQMDINGPLNSSSSGRSYPVGYEVIASASLSDQRDNAAVEGIKKRRKDKDINEPLNSINASSCFIEATGSITLSGQRNHTVVVRRQKEIDTNGPENITTSINNGGGVTEVMGSVPLSDCRNHAIVVGNVKKRKDIGINGCLYENEARPNKVPRLSPAHNSLENGRKLEEANQSVNLVTSEKHDGASAKSLQQKNSLIDATSFHILGPNPSVLISDQIIEKSRKTMPPHPDTEFLNQILTVPKMDEWTGFDDQEWLFCGQDPPPSQKPEMGSAQVNENLQVWSEALNIESMDIVAFPYVLPY